MALFDVDNSIEGGSGLAAAEKHFRKAAPKLELDKVA